jgi:hypothetical protein
MKVCVLRHRGASPGDHFKRWSQKTLGPREHLGTLYPFSYFTVSKLKPRSWRLVPSHSGPFFPTLLPLQFGTPSSREPLLLSFPNAFDKCVRSGGLVLYLHFITEKTGSERFRIVSEALLLETVD